MTPTSYYSYRTKSIEQEFFVAARTKIVVKLLMIGGQVEKWLFFSNGSYDQWKYPDSLIYLNMMYIKFCWKKWVEGTLWGVKVDIFAHRAQQLGFVVGFWWFLVLWSSQIYANNTEITPNQITCVFVLLYYPFGTHSSINCHIILSHYWFLSPMILPSDSESLLSASDSTPTSIICKVTSIKVFWTFEHQYYVILIKYSIK